MIRYLILEKLHGRFQTWGSSVKPKSLSKLRYFIIDAHRYGPYEAEFLDPDEFDVDITVNKIEYFTFVIGGKETGRKYRLVEITEEHRNDIQCELFQRFEHCSTLFLYGYSSIIAK